MDADAWHGVKAILAEVLEVPPAEREAYLAARYPDLDQKPEVLGLLRLYDDEFLRTVTVHGVVSSTAADDDFDLRPGTPVDRYIVLDRLGEGGMGKVFLATDTELHRKVALKCLTAREPEKDLRRKLLDEARAAGQLNHPNIATVYDVVEHEGRAYLVMECVEGENLANELRRERMPLHRTLKIGRELASALAAAHAKGIVHRDLKPANVQVMRNGSVKVLDFGVAQAISLLTSRSTTGGRADVRFAAQPGTPAYMSPEQLHRRSVDHRSDIYSLGVVLYEMATGHRPFASTDPLELITLLGKRLLQPTDANPDVPQEVSDVITKTLAVDPNERYQTAAEIEAVLAGLVVKYPAVPTPRFDPVLPKPWWLKATRAGGIVVLFVAFVGFVGYLETALFNETLGRTAPFDRESPGVWFQVGRQALVPLGVYALVILLGLWAARFGLSVLRLSSHVDQILTTGAQRTKRLTSRLRLDDPLSFAQACVAFGIVSLTVVYWRYANVIGAVMTRSISTLPIERVLPLSPGHRDDTTNYRFVMTVLILAFGFAAYRVAQIRARHPSRRGIGALLLVAVPLMGTVAMGVLPYRIMFRSDFERVDYAGERCYLLGESSDESLIHCPDRRPPRNRRVSRGDSAVQRSGITENIFTGPDTTR